MVTDAELVSTYTPVLVLYPEIAVGTQRQRDSGYPSTSPLLHDYHPRDIKMVLENAVLHKKKWRFWQRRPVPTDWTSMLDRMEKADYDRDLDVFPGVDVDEIDNFWTEYGDIVKSEPKYSRRCYARVVRGSGPYAGLLSIQYWYAYLYNDFWNTHEMDWEMAQVVLSETATGPVPFVCGYSAHMGGHWQSWSRIEKAISEDQRDDGGTHPVVYVANGSHANYFRGPARFKTANPAVEMAAELAKPQRKLLDYTTSWPEGDRQMVTAELVPEPGAGGRWTGDWRWLNQEARFGSPGDFDLEFGDSGPKGPPQQEKKWKSPFEWLDEDCSVAPTPDAVDPPTALRPE